MSPYIFFNCVCYASMFSSLYYPDFYVMESISLTTWSFQRISVSLMLCFLSLTFFSHFRQILWLWTIDHRHNYYALLIISHNCKQSSFCKPWPSYLNPYIHQLAINIKTVLSLSKLKTCFFVHKICCVLQYNLSKFATCRLICVKHSVRHGQIFTMCCKFRENQLILRCYEATTSCFFFLFT